MKESRKSRIVQKKKYGQHFLRDQSVVEYIVNYLLLSDASVFEIGCGDGFLTRAILQKPVKQIWTFEIDQDWAQFVRTHIKDDRLTVYNQDFLTVDFSIFDHDKPWILLANLPYVITFPILKRLQKHSDILREGIIMVQEEVAEKILKSHGRGYGYIALFFQYYFEWQKLLKISPNAFEPPPKVFSRLLYFKPKENLIIIPDEERFWKFIKTCFRQPRRTLRNNLIQTNFDITLLSEEILDLRAQQLTFPDFLNIWQLFV